MSRRVSPTSVRAGLVLAVLSLLPVILAACGGPGAGRGGY